MGTKVRLFGPVDAVSLKDLIPKNHLDRRVQRALDLRLSVSWSRPAMHLLDDRPSTPSCFQAPAHHVFRGDSVGAAAHGGRRSAAER